MSENELSGKVDLDTTDYKAGVTDLNRQIRIIESGFRASAAAMGDWDKTSEGLALRAKALTDQIDLQKQKIAALTSEYSKVVSAKGDDSRAAQELLIKINKQNEALGKMQTELKDSESALEGTGKQSAITAGNIKEVGKKSEESAEKSEKMKDAMQKMGGIMKGVGTVALGLAAAVAGIGAAVGKMVLNTAESSDALVELSDKTGLSVEKLQELNYIGKQVGTATETVTGSLARMIRNMNSAREGTGEAAEAFALLGISVTDSNGELRDSEEVFAEALDKLGGMTNETERDAAAMAIFGKSAQELNPLILAGADGLAKMAEEAHKSGAVMKTETVQGMADLNDVIGGLKDGLMGTVGTLAGSFLPAFQGLTGKAQGYLSDLAAVVAASNGDIGAAAGGIAGVITSVITDLVSSAPDMLEGGLGIIQGLMDGIMSNIPVLIPAVINMMMMLVNFILTNIPTLLTAAIQIVIAIANGISTALPQLIPSIIQAVITIVMTLLENLPMLIQAALQLILALAQGLIGALPVLINAIPEIMTALVNGIIEMLPMIIVAAVQLITTLAFGIVENIPTLISAIAIGIKNIIDAFKKTDWGKIGKDLVDGVSKGFMSAWNTFKDNVISGFNSMVSIIKKLLGIASPSQVFGEIGMNMAAGLGIGFKQELANFQNDLNGLVGGGFGLQQNFAGMGAGGSYDNSQRYVFYSPVVIQGGSGDLGEQLKAKRY